MVAVVFLVALHARAAGDVAWGEPANGLRMGLGFEEDAARGELHVWFENTGAQTEAVYLGYQSGRGTALEFQFFAKLPDGSEVEGCDVNLFTPIAGLMVPVSVSLKPGERYEWKEPLKNIVQIKPATYVDFASLVGRHVKFRVAVKLDELPTLWGGPLLPWMGKVASGVAVR